MAKRTDYPPITIPEAVKQLLSIVEEMRRAYPKKRFTLDGRLVGDIGEVLAEERYDIELFEDIQKHHDARTSDGRLVQIKATMRDSLTFPVYHVPDNYLGIQIHPDGSITEIFNGPGYTAEKAIKNRKSTRYPLHNISVSALKALNEQVEEKEKIPLRARK